MPRGEYSSASKGVDVRKQAQISPPPFFLRLSPIAGSGWKPTHRRRQNPPSCAAKSTVIDGKIHRRRRRSAGRAPAAFDENVFKAITALHTGTGTGTVGTDVSRGTKKQAINNLETNPAAAANPPLPQAFGWSGSRAPAAAAKSTVAAGVRLVGLHNLFLCST